MTSFKFYIISYLTVLTNCISTNAVSQFVDRSNAFDINHLHGSSVLLGGGATFIDVNNDNLVDLYLTGGDKTSDRLYLNLGNNRFHDISLESGILFHTRYFTTFGVVSGDINNDGCEDIFVTTHSENERNLLMLGDCTGKFDEVSTKFGVVDKSTSTSAAFLDFNNDGFLDIYVTNYTQELEFIYDENENVIGYDHTCYPNFLYVNNEGNSFSEVATQFGVDDMGCGFTSSTSDFDSDGDPDIYVINDFGEWVVPNRMLRNENGVLFTDVSDSSGLGIGLYGMGVATTDFEQDGDIDFYVTNIGSNALMINDGNNNYQDMASEYGVDNEYSLKETKSTSWGAFFADLDNNGLVDLYVANGYIPAAPFLNNSLEDDSKLFFNLGGIYEDVSSSMGLNSTLINRGAIYGDIDNDGFLDVVTVSAVITDLGRDVDGSLVSINQKSNGNWLQVDVEGTISNRNAFGTKIYIYTASDMQFREKISGGSHASQNSEIIHFGVSNTDFIDSLKIHWPSGLVSNFIDIEVNQRILIIEEDQDYQIMDCEQVTEIRCFYHNTLGCMDVNSSNYDIFATEDDGTCDGSAVVTDVLSSDSSTKIFPNPFINHLTISEPVDYLEILDLNGKVIHRFQTNEIGSVTIETSSLSKGIYLINGSLKGTKVLNELIIKD